MLTDLLFDRNKWSVAKKTIKAPEKFKRALVCINHLLMRIAFRFDQTPRKIMVSRLTGKIKLSREISTALDVLGYNTERMRLRQTHYDLRSKMPGPLLPDPPSNFGPAKIKVYLTDGKQNGSSIWDRADEDWMVVLDT